MRVVVGVDTSCYAASVAAVALDGRVVFSQRQLLPVPAGACGLSQSQAVFEHVRGLPPLFSRLRERHPGLAVCAFCASSKPRPVEEAYMPVFLVGMGQAQSAAAMAGVPCFNTNHQDGHIAAAMLGTGLTPGDRFLALHLSGGTTELLLCERGSSRILGGSLDLHAGQLVDRVGVLLGLPFPAGPSLEALALKGRAVHRLPVSIRGLGCHLSGAEAQLKRWIAQGQMSPEDMAAEVYSLMARTVARLLMAGQAAQGACQVLLAGGVSASMLFRSLLYQRLEKARAGITLHVGQPEYCGDNAAGVALIGLRQLGHTP